MAKNKPVVLKKGYINEYTNLNKQEKKQIKYKTLYKDKNFQWDESMVYLTKAFKKYVPINSVILDAGCGNGNYIIDENRDFVSKAIGIDTDSEFTKKNISMDEIVYSNLEHLPFPSCHFDSIVSLWVLEHLENPKVVFDELHRVLKPGGTFLFTTTNKFYLPIILMQILRYKNFNHKINNLFFGRKSEDIFRSHYRANTIEQIKNITEERFIIKELFL